MKGTIEIENAIMALKGFREMLILISASEYIKSKEQFMYCLWADEIEEIYQMLQKSIGEESENDI